MTAPANAHEASVQLDELQTDLEAARGFARKYGTAADRAEHLYRRESAKAAIQVEGKNGEQRAGLIHEWPLEGSALVESAAVAEAMGVGSDPARTVGEMRWLRDRSSRLADEWSATAYDRRARISAWMTVVSMSKAEMELGPPAQFREAS